jgi:hypothetical protein
MMVDFRLLEPKTAKEILEGSERVNDIVKLTQKLNAVFQSSHSHIFIRPLALNSLLCLKFRELGLSVRFTLSSLQLPRWL